MTGAGFEGGFDFRHLFGALGEDVSERREFSVRPARGLVSQVGDGEVGGGGPVGGQTVEVLFDFPGHATDAVMAEQCSEN